MFEDRKHQIEACDSVFTYLDKNPEGHPLVAMPTGSGKTVIMVRISDKILERNSNNKILILSHNSEILKQNYNAMLQIKGNPEIGLFSAGLKSRCIKNVTVAGIQSIYNKPELFTGFNYVIIDEAHTVPMNSDSMYRTFLDNIGKHTRIGLTATPYRLGQGYIVGNDHMFTKIVIDYTFGAKYTKLVSEGFLCPLVINNTKAKMDTEKIKMKGGDFDLKQMSNAFDRESLTDDILDELIIKAKDRKKWLIFAIDIKHADHICEGLISRSVSALSVHSDMQIEKDLVMKKHRNGQIRCVVSVGMLTTGYDDQSIDLIGLLRPTQSPNLHVQMPGRGQRVHESKESCLVLDYAGNTERLGPINKVRPHKKRKKGESGEPIIKTCPDCDTMVSPMTKICPECGHEFKFRSNLQLESSSDDIIYVSSKWYNITETYYGFHSKENMPVGIKATYVCGLRNFYDWILPNHRGYAGHLGIQKLKNLGHEYKDLDSALAYLNQHSRIPSKVLIDNSGKYPNVIDIELRKEDKEA